MGFSTRIVIAFAVVFAPLAVPVLGDFDGTKDVTLYLYTQSNPSDAEYVTADDSTSPSFNSSNPTRVVIHGWLSSVKTFLLPFRDAYIATGNDYNIILVDWSGLAANLYIPTTVVSGIYVGEYVAERINQLVDTRGADLGMFNLIGHSLGAHVAGIVGNRLGGDLVSEVVGLDPAAHTYDSYPLENQLDKTDGKFVQVIHTNDYGAGSADNIGHVDFYPNGGMYQTGCSLLESLLACSHTRALDYYVESITSEGFVASQCSSYLRYELGLCKSNEHVVMGESTPHDKSGKYYLDTNGDSPYAKGETSL